VFLAAPPEAAKTTPNNTKAAIRANAIILFMTIILRRKWVFRCEFQIHPFPLIDRNMKSIKKNQRLAKKSLKCGRSMNINNPGPDLYTHK
jgi:hypothetical protein